MTSSALTAYESGLAKLRDGCFADAIDRFRDAITADRAFLDAYYHLALAHYRSGQALQAERILTRLTGAAPHDPDVHLLLCRVRRDLKLDREAEKALAPVIRGSLLTEEQVLDASYELLSLGNRRRAIRFLHREVRHNPYSVKLIYRLGRTYADLGQERAAQRCFEQCLSLQPDHSDAKRALDRILRDENGATKSKRFLRSRKNKAGKSDAILNNTEKHEAANLISGGEDTQEDTGLLLALACSYETEGNRDAAIKVLERIKDDANVRGFACYRLGKLYHSLGRHDEAVSVLNLALEEDPDFEEARELMVSIIAGNPEKCQ